MAKYQDENNVWHELVLKPGGDTLPIGTIVDYDGPTVPTGYEQVHDRSIMTIAISEDYTTETNSAELLPCILRNSVGNKLIFDSETGTIKIGAGVSYIKVSANVCVKTPSVERGRHALYIFKNSEYIAQSVIRANGVNAYQSICCSPMVEPVSENDIISLQFRSQDAIGAVVYGLARSTYLTVEVIE